MKKITSTLLIVVLVFAGFIQYPEKAEAALTDDLVSVWELEESSGPMVDSFGSNDLTEENTPEVIAAITNNGQDMEEGDSDHFTITDAATGGTLDLDNGAFSIAMWHKPESLPTDRYEMATKNDGGGQAGWIFRWNKSGSNHQMFMRINDGGERTTTENITTPSTGTWYHWVVTYDDTANEINFYIDGSATGGSPHTMNFSNSTTNTEPVYIAARPSAGVDTDWYDGVIDQVVIWDRAITASEVSEIYNAGSGLPYSSWGGGGGDSGFNSVIIISKLFYKHDYNNNGVRV